MNGGAPLLTAPAPNAPWCVVPFLDESLGLGRPDPVAGLRWWSSASPIAMSSASSSRPKRTVTKNETGADASPGPSAVAWDEFYCGHLSRSERDGRAEERDGAVFIQRVFFFSGHLIEISYSSRVVDVN